MTAAAIVDERRGMRAGGARILTLGDYRPSRVVTNSELSAQLGVSPEWIQERTGVVERRWAEVSETVTDIAVAAGQATLSQAGVRPAEVDLVIVATISHFLQTPAAAPMVAHRLGAAKAAAMDLSAACAGFCYGLNLARDVVQNGTARHVLVIGAEKMSDLIDHGDRSTACLFGDGGGAALVGAAREERISRAVWGSDAGLAGMMSQDRSWIDSRVPDALASTDPIDAEDPACERTSPGRLDGPDAARPYFRMNGPDVFRWAVRSAAATASAAVARAGLTLTDIDAFVPHQANLRITQAVTKHLGLPDRAAVATDIRRAGNTSAASIPMALSDMLRQGTVHSGDRTLLVSFGAGLCYAAQVVIL